MSMNLLSAVCRATGHKKFYKRDQTKLFSTSECKNSVNVICFLSSLFLLPPPPQPPWLWLAVIGSNLSPLHTRHKTLIFIPKNLQLYRATIWDCLWNGDVRVQNWLYGRTTKQPWAVFKGSPGSSRLGRTGKYCTVTGRAWSGTQNQLRPRPSLEWRIRWTGYGRILFGYVLYRRCGFAYPYDWRGFVGTR